MMRTRARIIIVGVLVSGYAALLTGCATSDAQRGPAGRMSDKEALKAWKDVSKRQMEQVEAEDAKPLPEPKLQPMTHFSAGALYEKQGRSGQAIEQYRKAIELNPTFAQAYGRLGLCYLKAGQAKLAIEALTKASELQPKSATVWNNLGFAHLAAGNAAAAEASFSKSLAIQPTYERARTNMALALVRQGRDADALSHLQIVSPDYIARYNVGTMQLAAGRDAQARLSFEEALKAKAEFPAARKGLEQALARLANAPIVLPAVAEEALAVRSPATRPTTAIAEASAPCDKLQAEPQAEPSAQAKAAGLAERRVAECTPSDVKAKAVAWTYDADGWQYASWADSAVAWWDGAAWLDSCMALTTYEPLEYQDASGKPRNEEVAEAAPIHKTAETAAPSLDPVAVSVAEMDLTSLQWFAWHQMIETLKVDVGSTPEQRLVQAMRKWLIALEQLQDMCRPPLQEVALAN